MSPHRASQRLAARAAARILASPEERAAAAISLGVVLFGLVMLALKAGGH